jgi:predicted O-methyltransferase YrrM
MLNWDGLDLRIGDAHFRAVTWTAEVSTDDALVVWKYPSMIEHLARVIAEERPLRILELGIAQGGSVALLAALAPEAKVVAIDVAEEPLPALASHLERRGEQSRVRPHYGVDQGDADAVRSILREEFGGEPIDFVLDDASHELERTRRSFDTILPFVAPGGSYVIEDWSWSHHDATGLGIEAILPKGPPLTPLVVDMLMIVGSATGVLDRVDVTEMWAHARRGTADIDPERWTRSDSFYTNVPILLPEMA